MPEPVGEQRCPTCGETDPAKKIKVTGNDEWEHCPDPFHTEPVGEQGKRWTIYVCECGQTKRAWIKELTGKCPGCGKRALTPTEVVPASRSDRMEADLDRALEDAAELRVETKQAEARADRMEKALREIAHPVFYPSTTAGHPRHKQPHEIARAALSEGTKE